MRHAAPMPNSSSTNHNTAPLSNTTTMATGDEASAGTGTTPAPNPANNGGKAASGQPGKQQKETKKKKGKKAAATKLAIDFAVAPATPGETLYTGNDGPEDAAPDADTAAAALARDLADADADDVEARLRGVAIATARPNGGNGRFAVMQARKTERVDEYAGL